MSTAEASRSTRGAAASAQAAAQAVEAVAMWVGALTDEQCEEIRHRLLAKQEWTAAAIWFQAVEEKKQNKDGAKKK